MNSLNILSTRVIGQTPHDASKREAPDDAAPEPSPLPTDDEDDASGHGANNGTLYAASDEKTPLLRGAALAAEPDPVKPGRWRSGPRRIVAAFFESVRWLMATMAAPGFYLASFLYDDAGRSRLRHLLPRRRRRSGVGSSAAMRAPSSSKSSAHGEKAPSRRRQSTSSTSSATMEGDSSAILSSDSELDRGVNEIPAHHTRSKSQLSSSSEDAGTSRRSIRIKLYNQDNGQKRRRRGGGSVSSTSSRRESQGVAESDVPPALTPATLKSPTSPLSSLRMTKYPRAPRPPRPLVPRRTPSYTFPTVAPPGGLAQKTLILDLDETLIHSMAKGGRMSTGHMVEVKLNGPVGFSGGVAQGSKHPILYYVHKRPHCDDFLRKVCQWYNLVAFTASVQEYADPVIDWLEQDRKYFSGRYYRQHCTFRGGNYIKDISSIEPDLSKVMIVDNSPSSYVFHEDNAIPIEGWINDPTDNDLLHLIPLLEGLQHATDVRALLALRSGEPATV